MIAACMCMDVSSLTRILRNLLLFIPTKKHASPFPKSYLPVASQYRVGGAWRASSPSVWEFRPAWSCAGSHGWCNLMSVTAESQPAFPSSPLPIFQLFPSFRFFCDVPRASIGRRWEADEDAPVRAERPVSSRPTSLSSFSNKGWEPSSCNRSSPLNCIKIKFEGSVSFFRELSIVLGLPSDSYWFSSQRASRGFQLPRSFTGVEFGGKLQNQKLGLVICFL